MIVDELPEAALGWLREGPWTRTAIAAGRPLADVLADPERAAAWAGGMPPLARDTLALVVKRFGGMPFPEEKLVLEGGRMPIGWTGAELKLAVQWLRRDGILFAMDRPWGDRLLLLPEDMYPFWRKLLLPMRVDPLPEETWLEGCDAAASLLSHELISAWSAIRRTGLPLTSKGAPRKQETAKIAAAMCIRQEDCTFVGSPSPSWEGLPASVDLALRIGLAIGILRQEGQAIVAEPGGEALAWLALPAAEAELRLLDVAARCLLPAGQPEVWLAAESLRDLEPMRWYRMADIVQAMPTDEAAEAASGWIRFLQAAGWMETGGDADGAAVRWLIEPDEARLGVLAAAEGYDRYELMPDLEAIVPPEVPPGSRWELELLARRLSEDVVAVYRLDAGCCSRAQAGGLPLEKAEALLERGSGAPLPGAVRTALRDWYGPAATTGAVHDAPAEGSASASVDDAIPAPAEASSPKSADAALDESTEDSNPAFAAEARAVQGTHGIPARPRAAVAASLRGAASAHPAPAASRLWDTSQPVLSRKLYPGAGGIPPGWLNRPAAYHVSTLKEMTERAIAWGAAIRLFKDGEWMDFVPERMRASEGGGWSVWGRPFVREAVTGKPVYSEKPISIGAEEIGRLMIVLPDAGDKPDVR